MRVLCAIHGHVCPEYRLRDQCGTSNIPVLNIGVSSLMMYKKASLSGHEGVKVAFLYIRSDKEAFLYIRF